MKMALWDSWLGRLGRRAGVGAGAPWARRNRTRPRLERLEDRLAFDANSAGPLGIDALATGLTGRGIHIGQTEPGRPGLRAVGAVRFDNDANSHPDVNPAEVFLRDGAAVANTDVEDHATGVAGVMIANGAGAAAAYRGVATAAQLHSSADRTTFGEYEKSLLAMQRIARRNGLLGDLPAINMSWTDTPRPGSMVDGQSILSRGLDYFAERYNTLFVNTQGNDVAEKKIPTDAYDGLVVSAAKTNGAAGVYRQAVYPPALAAGNRRLIDVLAPGDNINVPEPTADGAGDYTPDRGSSFAAPHATGTVALLQEFARANGLGADSQRHEVMKAVVMNSADKVEGRLGMTRTVLKRDGTTNWDGSDAHDDPAVPDGPANPLDDEMGTGFLNARRAVTQLRGGEFAPGGAVVGPIGWDGRGTNGVGDINRYPLPCLKGGSWVSITLTWDRQVDLMNPDAGGLFQFDPANAAHQSSFVNPRLSNLELYLVPRGGGIARPIMASRSAAYNVEHIFFQLPLGNAQYDILVRQNNTVNAGYALAWWTEQAACPAPGPVYSPVGVDVFVVGTDGALKDNALRGGSWTWTDLGTPDGVTLGGSPSAVYSSGGIDVYVRGADGSLKWLHEGFGVGFFWNDLGTPSGVALAGSPSVVLDPTTLDERVYVLGTDGALKEDHGVFGVAFFWSDLGAPTGVALDGNPGAILLSSSSISVFVRGTDGALKLDAYDGTSWSWSDLGTPGGVALDDTVSVVSNAFGVTVFVRGTDGALKEAGLRAGSWGWADLGTPTGVTLDGSPSAVASASTFDVYILGSDGALKDDSFAGGFSWGDLGKPSGVALDGSPGAIEDAASGEQRIYLRGSDGALKEDHGIPGVGNTWSDLGSPPGGFDGGAAPPPAAAGGQTAGVPSGRDLDDPAVLGDLSGAALTRTQALDQVFARRARLTQADGATDEWGWDRVV